MARKIITEETKQQILTLYKQGVKLKYICETTGLTQPTISRIVKVSFGAMRKPFRPGRKITPRGQGNWKPYEKKGYNPANKKLNKEQEKELLADYFEKDMTYKEIMAKYNLWQNSIKIIVDKALAEGLYKPKGRGNHRKRKNGDI